MVSRVTASIGHHGLWGNSAAFDLVEVLHSQVPLPKHINVLLLEPGDIRHLLMILSRRRRQRCDDGSLPHINIYVLEQPMEVLARSLLLLSVLLDFEVPIRVRANTFLELFGNNLIQLRTSRYMGELSQRVYETIANSASLMESNDLSNVPIDFQNPIDTILNLSHLKMKQVDHLASIFRDNYKFPGPEPDPATCRMSVLRDHRLRGYYGERYDSRAAVGDWDYHHTFHTNVASIIHIQIFRDWRLKGIAFEFGDQYYTETNRSMLTFVEGTMKKGEKRGEKKEVRALTLW